MTRPRLAAPLLLALLASAAQASARPEPREPGPLGPAAQRSEDVPAVVREKRAIVLDPSADAADIASAATTLLQHKDVATLRTVLAGDAPAALRGVLAALGQADPEAAEPLLEDVVGFAARTSQAELRDAANRGLDNLLRTTAPAAETPSRVRRALGWISDSELPAPRREVVLLAFGRSKNLAWVDPLIGALSDGSPATARAALVELTGHDVGPDASPDEWRTWWDKNRGRSREDLMEESRRSTKQRDAVEIDRLTRENIELKLKDIGDSTASQIAALSNPQPEVRHEVARRLSLKPNDELARSAVPVLLRRLGVADTNGSGPVDVGDETDPHVRAMLVTALGVLDRSSPAVRAALIAELKHPNVAVRSAAALALEQFRNQREIVRPLLEYLTTLTGNSVEVVEARVKALNAIAANSPSGVLDLITSYTTAGQPPYTTAGQPPAVRAAAVGAVIACDEIEYALEGLAQTWRTDSEKDVRFSLAAALGDRLGKLPPEANAAVRQPMVSHLGYLLSDLEPSVRLEAAASLGRSGSLAALALLEARGLKETVVAVQKGLIQAVGALRQADGARVIGALLAAHKEGREGLLGEAVKALGTIAGDRSPQAWLDAATALDTAGSHDLAAICCTRVISDFPQPEHADVVARANAMLPVQLLEDGQAAKARELLRNLDDNDASQPPRAERQLLLARACGLLGDWAGQADWLTRHVRDLPAGDARRAPEMLAAAQAWHKAGKDAEALPLLNDYLAALPADNQALLDRAAVQEALGQADAALADLVTLLARLPEGDALREPALAAQERLKARTAGPVAPPAVPSGESKSEAAATGEVNPPHGD